jgi:hypothetical protein
MLRAFRQGRGRGDLTVGWQDPSPRVRTRTTAGTRAARPGYGAGPDIRLSFGTLAWRAAQAAFAGVLAYAAAHAGMVSLHGGGAASAAHATLDIAVSVAVAVLVGWLILRMLLSRPQEAGLPRYVRESWYGRRRGWNDSYAGMTFGEAVAADAIGEVVGAVIDAVTD